VIKKSFSYKNVNPWCIVKIDAPCEYLEQIVAPAFYTFRFLIPLDVQGQPGQAPGQGGAAQGGAGQGGDVCGVPGETTLRY
jgi:hypothetical protein